MAQMQRQKNASDVCILRLSIEHLVTISNAKDFLL